jgi:peptidoglycan/LPS O-acetylase OafA/YrhL
MRNGASMAQWFLQPIRTETGVFHLIDALRGLAAVAVVIYHYTLSPAEAEFDGLTARSETIQLCL